MKPEKLITMSFRLPESLHRRLREYTNQRGLKIQHAVKEAISAMVAGAPRP